MYKNKKNIAVLMSTYNGEKYLEEQLNSIIAQDNSDWTLYIRDDGSTDNTAKILSDYTKKYDDIVFINENEVENLGVVLSFFKILEVVDSSYYMFCDQDDVWMKNKITVMNLEMTRQDIGKPILVHSDLELVDSNLKTLDKYMFEANQLPKKIDLLNLVVQNSVTGCTMFFNNALKNQIKFDEISLDNILMHDWLLALLAYVTGEVVFVGTPTIYYRQHENNVVGSKTLIQKIIKGYGLKEMRNSLIGTKRQASYFLKNYSELMREKDVRILSDYVGLYEVNRYNKLRILKSNKFYKNDLLRNIMFYFLVFTIKKSKGETK